MGAKEKEAAAQQCGNINIMSIDVIIGYKGKSTKL